MGFRIGRFLLSGRCLVFVLAWVSAWPHAIADAQAIEVDLELVLAVDMSGSMDARERAAQRGGYVEAFRHDAVVGAIRSGAYGRIAVTYVEWAGAGLHSVVVPWTVIEDAASAARFAATLEAAPTNDFRGTSISDGLTFAADQFDVGAHDGLRQVIDISGDGPNNRGRPVLEARAEVLARGITINGLPIVLGRAGGGLSTNLLDVYYEECVIGGPGAFMITVDDIDRIGQAIRRKLVLEIAGRPARVVAAVMHDGGRIDCMIGEHLRRDWFDDP
jgi:hypothetical protein